MKVLIAYSNAKFSAHIHYVFEHLARTIGFKVSFITYTELSAGAPDADIIVSYGRTPPNTISPDIHITEADLFSANYLKPESLPQPPLPCYNNLPILFGKKENSQQWIEESEGQFTSHIDIVAGTFFLLTRYEELVKKERDRYRRFPAASSIAIKADFIGRPLADEYGDLFALWIKRFQPSFEAQNPWGNHPFAFYVTHDVDAPRKYRWKNILRSPHAFRDGLPCLLGKRPDPYWTFPELISLEKEYGIKADYFFLAGGRHPLDRAYSIGTAYIRRLINEIREGGAGIGIHFSLTAHLALTTGDAAGEFAKELAHFIAVIGLTPVGSRQHFLALSIPETWRRLDTLGIRFDASCGFAEVPGFRCGTSRPFRCFDAERGRLLGLYEIPLVAMDSTFIHHIKCSPEDALAQMNILLGEVAKHHGVFSLLWHNHTLSEEDHPGWGAMYRQFLKEAAGQNPLFSRPVNSGR